MKLSWVPAALMVCIGLGYLAGSVGRDARKSESREYQDPTAPVLVGPTPSVVDPPALEPPREPIPAPAPSDGLGAYPAWNGVDLDCADIGHPVRVPGRDPHRLDNDGNGVGCEHQ